MSKIINILDEVLDDVQPIATFAVGEHQFEVWKPDHISEAANLVYVDVQVTLMVLGRQYQAVLDELNDLSNKSDPDINEQAKIRELSQALNSKMTEMLVPNCRYIEALTETKIGAFQPLLEKELGKRSERKKPPTAKFVNQIVKIIRDKLEEIEQQEREREEESDIPKSILELPPKKQEKKLMSSSAAA